MPKFKLSAESSRMDLVSPSYLTPGSRQFLLVLGPIILLLQTLTTIQSQHQIMLIYCYPEFANYTSGSQFELNLNNLVFPALISNGSSNGYFNTTLGDNPDTIYALSQCRDDISVGDCRSCLNTSTVEIMKYCSNKKDATMRLEDCMIRYSNTRFFSQFSQGEVLSLSWKIQNVSDQVLFNSQLGDLMNNLSSTASTISTRFATGSVRHSSFSNIYGLVQCTQDLSSTDCSSCLDVMISQIPSCCGGKKGGMVLGRSCYVRFEDYLFFQLLSPPHPPPPHSSLPPSPPIQAPELPFDTGKQATGNNGRSAKSSSSNLLIIVIVVAIVTVALALAVCVYIVKWRRTRRHNTASVMTNAGEIRDEGPPKFDFKIISDATNNFSASNKLGEGGFGPVYKGMLQDGREIAVKKLSCYSSQGSREFENEAELLYKLQHRNLVRLYGFCLEGEEKILIYEYLPRGSLDQYLYDDVKKVSLDWRTRYKVITGIARGLLYLHVDSRLRIIHRDVKPANILLDVEKNAKIADFGTAKHFIVDETHGNATRVAGTFAYMAPEYVNEGLFSVKSDVFSFGVLLLEIVSGRRPGPRKHPQKDLLTYARYFWDEGTPLELVDPLLTKNSSEDEEAIRIIEIGLLCAQENPDHRPDMSDIDLWLKSKSATLPTLHTGMTTCSNVATELDGSNIITSSNVVNT